MLLTRSLPPQFLLPAWGTRKLYQVLQHAHISDHPLEAQRKFREVKKPRPRRPGFSLFEELFPEQKIREDKEREELDKLPPFQWEQGPGDREIWGLGGGGGREGSRKDERRSNIPSTSQDDHVAEGQRREESVLILNCASKTLEESDFFRVSRGGEHIERWTRSIIKGADYPL